MRGMRLEDNNLMVNMRKIHLEEETEKEEAEQADEEGEVEDAK